MHSDFSYNKNDQKRRILHRQGAIDIERKTRYTGARVSRKPKKKKKKTSALLWIIPAGLVVAVLAAGFVLKFSPTIYPNVSIGGVDVGGMGREEAVQAVQTESARTYGQEPLVLSLGERDLTIRPEDAGIAVDADSAVDEAMRYGRSGGPVSALVNWFRCRSGSYSVNVADSLVYDEAYLRDLARSTAAELESRLRQSNVSYNEEQQTLTVFVGAPGRHPDPEELFRSIVTAYGEGQFRGASYDYEQTLPEPVDLSSWAERLCTPSKDASYDEKTHTLTPEETGYGFDPETEQTRVDSAPEGETIVISLGELIPDVTLDDLEKDLFPDVLASYDSPHTAIAARTNNLILACKTIDGTILNPGEVFSFNKTVGERTADRGFQAATVYTTGGASEPELGGGVCQVASTIYLCTLLADLEVVERTEHMYAVTYVPMGMDATVYWGSLDYKFRNSTENPLRIRASVSDGKVHIKLLGTKESDQTVEMTYHVLATIPWEEVEKVDETKDPGFREVTVTPYTGYRVQTFKNYHDKNGELIKTENCAYSSYRKRDKIITVGPEEAPPEETTDVEPTETVTPVDPTPAPDPAATPEEPAPAPADPTPPEPAAEPTPPAAETNP